MSEHYDIIIVGGGMVGGALGAALGNGGLRVAVLESQPPAAIPPDSAFDLRVSSVNLASQHLLENVGAWDAIVASRRLCPWSRIRVWEEGGGATEFIAEDAGVDSFGHFVENRLIQWALAERLKALPGVDYLAPAAPENIRIDPDAVRLETGEASITASLLVGADGARSRVREVAGIGTHSWDYEQGVVVASARTMLPQQEISWQRFTPSGPQAFLPLPGHHASLVWYHRPAEVKRLLALDDADFMSELEATFPQCLGGVSGITARGSFPLRRMHAHRYVDRRVALVGDAAHTVHPLAGQGVNLGMLDAAVLAEVLLTALGRAEDIGDSEVLARYERRRRRDILAMMGVIDIFYRLFGNDVVPVKLLRNLGLEVANRLTPAKRQVMRFALGLTGEAPTLVRSPGVSS